MTSYAQQALDAITEELPGRDPGLLKLYALLVLTSGWSTSLEDVHDAWSTWMAARRPGHPAIVPFASLSREVQELDRKYLEAIHRAAGKIGGAVSAEGVMEPATRWYEQGRRDALRDLVASLEAKVDRCESGTTAPAAYQDAAEMARAALGALAGGDGSPEPVSQEGQDGSEAHRAASDTVRGAPSC